MKWTIKRSSLSLLSVLILVGQLLPASSANNQGLLCAGAGGLVVGVGAGLGEQSPSGSNNGFSWSVPTSISRGGGEVIEMDFRGIQRKKNGFLLLSFNVFLLRYGLTCYLAQVLVTSSSGILSVTLVESGWAGEGPGSGCPRGREGEEDPWLKVILSTLTVENNKVIYSNHFSLLYYTYEIAY